MDENKRLAMRRKHSKYAHTCPFCEKQFYGNGGYGNHMRKEFLERMPEYRGNNAWTTSDLRREYWRRYRDRHK